MPAPLILKRREGGDALSNIHWCSMWENCNKCKLWCRERDLSRHSGQILSCDRDDRELWLTLPRLFRASRDRPPQPSLSSQSPPSGPVSHHNSSPSDVTNVETRSLCPLSSKSKIQYKLTRLRQCNGTDVILTHSKLTHDWHEYLFSYKRCKSFPQLNCDADKSCHNKQYLWLRRLWAIVAVTEKIKLLNEWVDAEVSF